MHAAYSQQFQLRFEQVEAIVYLFSREEGQVMLHTNIQCRSHPLPGLCSQMCLVGGCPGWTQVCCMLSAWPSVTVKSTRARCVRHSQKLRMYASDPIVRDS